MQVTSDLGPETVVVGDHAQTCREVRIAGEPVAPGSLLSIGGHTYEVSYAEYIFGEGYGHVLIPNGLAEDVKDRTPFTVVRPMRRNKHERSQG